MHASFHMAVLRAQSWGDSRIAAFVLAGALLDPPGGAGVIMPNHRPDQV
jgi:hypothetical protein